MEAPRGAGASWLHSPHRDVTAPRSVQSGARDSQPAGDRRKDTSAPTSTSSTEPEQNGHHPFRHHLHHHQDSSPAKKGSKDKTLGTPSPRARSSSWISNISSKFSSSSNTPNLQLPSPAKPLPSTPKEHDNPASPSVPGDSRGLNGAPNSGHSPNASPLPSPKSSGPSFLQSALRRLSSSGGAGMGKAAGSGGLCPRRVLNVDTHRERCQVENLQPGKLRRVSFCVDVQIATAASTEADNEQKEKRVQEALDELEISPDMHTFFNEYKPGQIDKIPSKKKGSDQSLRAKEVSEGAALKHPNAIAQAKDQSDGDKPCNGGTQSSSACPAEEASGGEPPSKKKEKKKRSEEERKERKEKRKQQAVANGSVPIEIALDDPSPGSTSGSSSPPQLQQSQPTTDPLRIYKRCCQLRESRALKRIADQLTATSPNGVIGMLDLSGLRFQLSDVVTLGDFLAVVPVRKLNLSDCALTDEALRVILAGLLSVKTTEQATYNKKLVTRNGTPSQHEMERFGVIDKLWLKNNSKLSREGWRHLSIFIHMSRSIRAIDLTGVPFPTTLTPTPSNSSGHSAVRSPGGARAPVDTMHIFGDCLARRLAGPQLEELILAGCELKTEQVEKIADAFASCGGKRLSVANNTLTDVSIEALARYVESGKCEALDVSGNDLSETSGLLTSAISRTAATCPIYALSLEGCNLSVSHLSSWLPTLTQLKNFRFLDLSRNRRLFSEEPSAVCLLREYLPQMPVLKRLNVNDISMSTSQCISLAEILPEIPSFSQISLLDNPAISAVTSAKDEAGQQEASAVYAAFMAAARVSKTLISVEVASPSKDSSELVQALSKQVVAYCLRNMEAGPMAEVEGRSGDTSQPVKKFVEVPEILIHLVGHVDGYPENHDDDAPAPDEDYIVSGNAVCKALSICLDNKGTDVSRPLDSDGNDGRSPLVPTITTTKNTRIKAMSMDMLDSARKIRTRLQPALARECARSDDMSLKRLLFLDGTLKSLIERFEDEYPECRQPDSAEPRSASVRPDKTHGLLSPSDQGGSLSRTTSRTLPLGDDYDNAEDEDSLFPRSVSRRGSEISLASKSLADEEGRVHRIGQKVRRHVLNNDMSRTEDYDDLDHRLQALKHKYEAMSGAEVKAQLEDFDSNDKDSMIAEVVRRFQEKHKGQMTGHDL